MIRRRGPAEAGELSDPPPSVRVRAPAKVNLFLEVLGRRTDGYHEIATLLLAIDLTDELDIRLDPAGKLSLTCDAPDLPAGADNLVLKAARRLREESGCAAGAAIGLTKRIPWAAGLGGGSSDAAAALAGLNELWQTGLSPADLARIGAGIGSDVPFFLNGPAAWCTGRGEVVRPATVGRPLDLVLVKPPAGLGTADVYRRVRAAGAAGALMSGSGSSLFALCRSPEEARRVHDDLSRGWATGDVSRTRTFLVRSRP